VQATAAAEDLNRADIARRGSPQSWNQFHRKDDGCPVRQLDRQCAFTGTVLDAGSARLGVRRAAPDLGRASQIRTQFVLYPVRHRL